METDKKNAREVYGDIIDREHYADPNRPRMSRSNRAAQFSPFAALTGYGDLIGEAARQTSERIELDDSRKEALGRRVDALLRMASAPQAELTYFVRDDKKTGGAYETAVGRIVGFDALSRAVRLDTGLTLQLDDLVEVRAACFDW